MRTEIILSRTGPETWVAVKEDGRVVELLVDRDAKRSLVGNIYLGRVSRVMPGMQAAFVDIGLDRDAFLYAGDMPAVGSRLLALAGEDADPDPGVAGPEPERAPDIRRLVRRGQEIVVQVSKDPLGTKGARLTGVVTLAGRRLVLVPEVAHVGVSRRIEPPLERERLREEMDRLRPEGGGLIVRTAGDGEDAEALRPEMEALRAEWSGVQERAASSRAPAILRREVPLALRVVRDHASGGLDRVVADTEDLVEACRDLVRRGAPELVDRIALQEGPGSLLDREAVAPAIDKALRAKVWLRSGGYLIIHPTEALVAIDVNSGRYLGRKDLEDTALSINLEAAREVAHQIRLRDLGGIIVVDFIDMVQEESRERLMREVEECLAGDRARTRVLGLSEFGLLALTRKRTRPSLERSLSRPCPYCSGRGRIRSAEAMAGRIARAVRQQAPGGGTLRLRVHPEVAAELRETPAWLEGAPRAVDVEPDETLHREAFELTEG